MKSAYFCVHLCITRVINRDDLLFVIWLWSDDDDVDDGVEQRRLL